MLKPSISLSLVKQLGNYLKLSKASINVRFNGYLLVKD